MARAKEIERGHGRKGDRETQTARDRGEDIEKEEVGRPKIKREIRRSSKS